MTTKNSVPALKISSNIMQRLQALDTSNTGVDLGEGGIRKWPIPRADIPNPDDRRDLVIACIIDEMRFEEDMLNVRGPDGKDTGEKMPGLQFIYRGAEPGEGIENEEFEGAIFPLPINPPTTEREKERQDKDMKRLNGFIQGILGEISPNLHENLGALHTVINGHRFDESVAPVQANICFRSIHYKITNERQSITGEGKATNEITGFSEKDFFRELLTT